MKKITISIIVLLLLAAGAGYWYWETHKKGIIKDAIQNALSNKTDSLYYVKYDSSMIDEVNGNVYFGNVSLQSDSSQEVLLKAKDSLPNVLINVHIKSLIASGIDFPKVANEKKVYAKKIIIDSPKLVLINTGEKQLKKEDTLALYKKMIGKFKSIKADTIEIRHATFISKNLKNVVGVEVKNAHVVLSKLEIDSTKDYSNVISYFIKNSAAEVESIYIDRPNKKSAIVMNAINYDAFAKKLIIGEIKSIAEGKTEERIHLNELRFEGLNINDFVERQIINVGKISTNGGVLTVFVNKKDVAKKDTKKVNAFDFPEEFFEEIKIGAISIGNFMLIIRSKENPEKDPIIIKNFNFNLSENLAIPDHYTLRALLDNAQWKMSADGFSMLTKDKVYTIFLNGLKIDKGNSSVSINQLHIKPNISEAQFVKTSTIQKDYFNILMKDISMQKVNLNKFINENILEVQQADLNLDMRVFDDRTLPPDPESKVGKYPHQQLLKLKFPLYIHRLNLHNAYISYRERALETQKIGNLEFNQVNATIDNVTNMPSYIATNPICLIKGTGLLLNSGKASTVWKLYLNSSNGKFELDGEMGRMDFSLFNPLIMPLTSTSASGVLNNIKFSMAGDDYGARGNLVMLYNDLKIETFNAEEEKKKNNTIISNLVIKNNNPSNGETRTATFDYKRDPHKSFFNLIWKSIFEGAQKTFISKGILDWKQKSAEKKEVKKE